MNSTSFTRVLFEIFLITGFFAAGVYMLMDIYGYRYDIQSQNLEKISIIDIGGKNDEAVVFLDGIKLNTGLPFAVKNVTPGLHHVRIEKPEFLFYNASILVFPDLVTKIDSVVMMPEKFNFIVVKEGDAAGKIFDNSGLLDGVSVKGDKIIYIKGNELWIRSLAFDINRFISRFYNSVSRAVFYSDDYNILFVSSGNLNFCDQIMQNCYVLRSFSNGDQFAVDGERIFFKEKSGKISVLNLAQN